MGMTNAVVLGARPFSRKVLNPMPDTQRRMIMDDKRYIYNVSVKGWGPIYRTHSVTQIFPNDPALLKYKDDLNPDIFTFGEKDGIRYSRTTVFGRIELVDSGIEDRYNESVTSAEQIADDITRHCNENCMPTDDGVPSFSGIFWSNNPEPTKREIRDAHEQLFGYYKSLVNQGNRLHANEDNKNITFAMRDAAKELNVQPPWVHDVTPMEVCPACGASVRKGVAICKECNAVLDEAKARKFYPERFAKKEATPKTI